MKLHNDWRDSELSALFDGELMSDDAERCLQKNGQILVERWCDYQDVRAALQGGGTESSQAFLNEFRARLAQDQAAQPQAAAVVQPYQRQAANDSVFRWKLVAGLASCAAVAVLAWSVVGNKTASPVQATLAQSGPVQNFVGPTFASPYAKVQGFARMVGVQPVAMANSGGDAAQREVMLRDPALDEFLRAHGARAGAMALENTSGFMRNATYGRDGL